MKTSSVQTPPAIVRFPMLAIFLVASSLYRIRPWLWWRDAGWPGLLAVVAEIGAALLLAWLISGAARLGIRWANTGRRG
jgi:hypothetical protein